MKLQLPPFLNQKVNPYLLLNRNSSFQPQKINSTLLLNDEDNTLHVINRVFRELNELNSDYPKFDNWLENKVFPGLYDDSRSILLQWRNNQIAGISILKNTDAEKKICCVRIHPEFRNGVLGVALFQNSMIELDTNKPLLSISSDNKYFDTYTKMFEYFGFSETIQYANYYRANATEIVYNGILK